MGVSRKFQPGKKMRRCPWSYRERAGSASERAMIFWHDMPAGVFNRGITDSRKPDRPLLGSRVPPPAGEKLQAGRRDPATISYSNDLGGTRHAAQYVQCGGNSLTREMGEPEWYSVCPG